MPPTTSSRACVGAGRNMSDLTARQFKITVESVYGPLVPQVVEASSLPAALREALKIPFVDWLEPDDEET